MNTQIKKSHFEILSAIDISKKRKKKDKFDYLSWADAVQLLSEQFPDAHWEIHEFEGMPFKETPRGCFVKVSVTVKGISRTQWHPVLNFRNKPIDNPNSFEINASIQRCLAKAIALHGLGLSLYTGEDLPPDNPPPPPKSKAIPVINPASKEQKKKIMEMMTKTKTEAGDMREIMDANPQLKPKNFNTITPADAELIIELLIKKQSLMEVKDGDL